MESPIQRELDIEEGAWNAFVDATPDMTQGGRRQLRSLVMSKPLASAQDLQRRQDLLRGLADGVAPSEETKEIAIQARLAELEADVQWIIDVKRDEGKRAIYDEVLLDSWLLGPLLNRRSPMTLLGINVYRVLVSPAVGVLTPVVYFLIPYLLIARRTNMTFVEYIERLLETAMRVPSEVSITPFGGGSSSVSLNPVMAKGVRSISVLLSIGIYIHGVVANFTSARAIWDAATELRVRMKRVDEFIRLSSDRVRRLWDPRMASQDLFGSTKPVEEGEYAPGHAPLGNGAAAAAAAEGVPWWKSLANCLHAYAAIDVDALENKLLDRFYMVDAAMGVLRIRENMGMSWTNFLQDPQQSPEISMRGLMHPALGTRDAVRNDVSLGSGSGSNRHTILTGPNAGGKSTLMKAVLACAVLSQTLTISPCDGGCTMTPFARILSHINVADNIGRASMFEAEMRRVQQLLGPLERSSSSSSSSGFVLVALDELFSSTNPTEAVSAAVACARRLASHDHVISLTSTHFEQICHELRASASFSFSFYHMPVARHPTRRNIVFPYLLKPGISRQRVALELMAANPKVFDLRLIMDALVVKRRLDKCTPGGRCTPASAPESRSRRQAEEKQKQKLRLKIRGLIEQCARRDLESSPGCLRYPGEQPRT